MKGWTYYEKNSNDNATYVYMPIGMCLEMVIGMLFENGISIGLSVGMAIGLIVGIIINNKTKNNKLQSMK